jgi:hypothetical protein
VSVACNIIKREIVQFALRAQFLGMFTEPVMLEEEEVCRGLLRQRKAVVRKSWLPIFNYVPQLLSKYVITFSKTKRSRLYISFTIKDGQFPDYAVTIKSSGT